MIPPPDDEPTEAESWDEWIGRTVADEWTGVENDES